MKYTVIVPVYNGEDTIEHCLRSLIDQKNAVYNSDYTILVVDDGSTDRTAQIAAGFPVEIIRLPKNEGRIIARLTGAEKAGTGKILFVDSRVTIPDDTIAKLDDFGEYPAVIGELHSEEMKYESAFHTILYLIRRRYYGKEYFPMQGDELLITEDNFKRAPKGTAVLLIDRKLFIELTPERTGKDVNDDTLLFQNLVFNHELSLLRSKRLSFKYSQRTDLRQFSAWLFHRGVRFSDFYLRPGGYFFIPFLLLAVFSALIVAVAAMSLIKNPGNIYLIFWSACALDAALSFYLAENQKDFFPVFTILPLISLIFGAGVGWFWAGMLKASLAKRLK